MLFTRQTKCPECGGINFTRRHRSFWLRWIPRSRLYFCNGCKSRVVVVPPKSEQPPPAVEPVAAEPKRRPRSLFRIYFTRHKQCPNCGGNNFTRRSRWLWMRWISDSRYYRCNQCRRGVLVCPPKVEALPGEAGPTGHGSLH